MAVKVTINRAHLEARLARGKEHCLPILAEQVLQDCNQYSVPDDGEHTLKDSGRTQQRGSGYVVSWNTVYAAYQYYGCWPDGSHVVRHHTAGYTQNPSKQWAEVAKARYMRDWAAVAQREMRRGMG